MTTLEFGEVLSFVKKCWQYKWFFFLVFGMKRIDIVELIEIQRAVVGLIENWSQTQFGFRLNIFIFWWNRTNSKSIGWAPHWKIHSIVALNFNTISWMFFLAEFYFDDNATVVYSVYHIKRVWAGVFSVSFTLSLCHFDVFMPF